MRTALCRFIQEVRTREKQLLEEIQNVYGPEMMDYVTKKKDISSQVDSLRSTCNLTEVILKGKDIEMLLLRKDVHEKLSSLEKVDIKTLPTTVTKEINFVVGSIDLGYLHDLDRPVLTKMRMKKLTNSEEENIDYNRLASVMYFRCKSY
jgi:hypothetical protein